MTGFDRRRVVVLAVLVATTLQVGAAGLVHSWRETAVNDVAVAEENLQDTRVRAAAHAVQVPDTPVVAVPSGPRWHLLEGAEVAVTLERLGELGNDAGVAIDVVKPVPSNQAGKQTFQVTGRGRPALVCEFLAAIENENRLVLVDNGRFGPGDDEEIVFELGLATYDLRGVR